MNSFKSSHYITRSSLSLTLSGLSLLCDDLHRPVAFFFFLNPLFHIEPYQLLGSACVKAVLSTVPVPTSGLVNVYLWNVLIGSLKLWSSLSLPETLLYQLCVLHRYFWNIPNSQGTLLFFFMTKREQITEKSFNVSVSQTTAPGWSHRTEGRIPLLPGKHPVPGQLSCPVGLGSLVP